MRFLSKSLAFLILLSAFAVFSFSCGGGGKTTKYEITAELDGNTVTGEETVVFYNDTDNAFKELKFNLFANAFRKNAKRSPISAIHRASAYYNGESYGGIEILSVKCGGEDVEFSICGEDENILCVPLKTEVYPSESVKITIAFRTTLARVVARTGINENTVNLANFYPILCGIQDGGFYECVYYSTGDPFFSDCADYKVTFVLPEEFVLATSGKILESSVKDGKRTETFYVNSARSFAAVASEKFGVVSGNVGKTQVNYYYYDDENPEEFLSVAEKSLTLFNDLFGEYPYPVYSVAKTGFIEGGMEFPALTFISDSLEKSAFSEVIAHETAHQWWQTVVGNNEIEYAFLDEGLAEYSVVLFYENYPEYGFTRKTLLEASEKTYKMFCSVSDKLFGKTDTSMMRGLKDFGSEYEYVNVCYVQPCIMYDLLRTTAGDKVFFSGLKKYYREYFMKNATPDGLISCFCSAGADVEGFFDGFLYGKVIL